MARLQKQRQDSLTRLLIYALGVNPQEFYLLPNAQGWVSIKDLLRALLQDENSPNAREGAIREAATLLAPDELEITHSHIRARHRQPLNMEYAVEPPGHLYFGARPKSYAHVLDKGLTADQGPLILLPNADNALKLARRREPDPILLTIQARKARERGVVFDLLNPDMYLCQHIDKEFLLGPAAPETVARKAPPAQELPPEMGSFVLSEEKPYKQKGIKKDIAWKKQRKRGQRG